MKIICLWCGKSHMKRPKVCKDKSKLLNKVIDKSGLKTFQIMRCLEVYGFKGIEMLAKELGIKR